MTRIDFHSNVSNYLEYACRLTRKAVNAGCKLIVLHQNSAQMAEFDALLWSFSPTDFIPHVSVSDRTAQVTPVLLGLHEDLNAQPAHREILLNLSNRVPNNVDLYERLIEIVPQQTDATQAGRERYRYYQQLGYSLNHINAK